ncbi:uncharacterized protein YbcV (DUF1398 family) [Flavobacterium croceum DSM 17960]|uniref:Uncharacterized protein YbcV (DUF1398 family) n=1 Tax=Flavobacterium croceum DSM 17960 TaxID=1121886 RepID=A0A2S4N667_9FLAO|nr:DUF1398 family protein [Flavobacterium croceum]POS01208.1 uncharacterized protein YbcV (DUF1398 family) [Flavobacterium croceum DSM 17960]
MFTVQQIKDAHSKVKSGADFPKYIQDIIALGVTAFETFVFDNHTVYYGINNFQTSSEGFFETLTIAEQSNLEQFKADLKSHQQGKTDYMTFLKDCAKSGVEKWIVAMDKMTCSYFDKAGKEMIVETIPSL